MDGLGAREAGTALGFYGWLSIVNCIDWIQVEILTFPIFMLPCFPRHFDIKLMTTPTTVYLVRHGHVHNPQEIIYGRLARFRLSERGTDHAVQSID